MPLSLSKSRPLARPRPAITRKESNELTRRRLVNGAIQLLREKGVAGATTGRIAKAAGIKQSSFYAHFADRDEVLEVAAGEIGGMVLEKMKRQHAKLDPKDVKGSVRRAFRSMGAAFFSEPELTRIFLRHRSDDTSPLGRTFRRLLDRARLELKESFHLYGLTASAEAAQLYAEVIVASTMGVLEAVFDGRVRDADAALDLLGEVTFAALRAAGQERRLTDGGSDSA
ncbi:TetR/AcrR family transcriptional regulator [Pendulispora albinea]|uniref:TetR/AcrR family transcriptional regulator n=1 Tax=Pendulispora albinea TaxID=2741071 RepID=A0ABZ2LSG1_9BACT